MLDRMFGMEKVGALQALDSTILTSKGPRLHRLSSFELD